MKSINEIYNLVLETLILEATSLEEIYNKYYSNDKELDLTLDVFKSINLIDPTGNSTKRGKYLDWLIRKAYKQNSRLLEDVDKIKEDLELFDKNYRHINKQITQIKDQYELASLVEEFREKKEKGEIDLSRSEIKKDVEKIYEDSDWLILTPKTEEAAKYYGKNTRWCTAAENDNYFDEYNKDGPLYILINKKVSDEKYQFHFQSDQYMDSGDNEIEWDIYNIFPGGVLDKLVELAKKNNRLIEFIKVFSTSTQSKYKNIYAKEYNAYDLGKQLLNAVKYNDLETVKYLLEHGANIHIDDDKPLRNAVEKGNFDIVQYLIDSGADIRTKNDEVLRVSATKGYLDIVKYLLEHGANIHAHYDQALKRAMLNYHFEVVKYLIDSGADIHAENDEVLRIATNKGHLETVKYLVEKGANIHAENDIALRNAAHKGFLDVVKYLVEKGADIHARDGCALRYAANNGHLEIVKYLVEKGADIHADDDQALKDASYYGHLDIMKYLIKKGANIHNRDVIVYAILNDKIESIKYLIAHGVDVSILTPDVLRQARTSSMTAFLYTLINREDKQ